MASTKSLAIVTNRVNGAQHAVHKALADLICNSDEFHNLFAEQTKAWARLRGIRKTFALIQRALSGQMPQQLADKGLPRSRSTPKRCAMPWDRYRPTSAQRRCGKRP